MIRRPGRSAFQSRNPGIDDRRIRLGCTQSGESPSTFGDALWRLVDRATYLYQDGPRYWFSTQPSVARLAEDRAAQHNEADVDARIAEWLRKDQARGEFERVHIAPDSSADIPDEMEARLVILGPGYPYVKADGGRALPAAENLLTTKGSGQRLYRNMLVFLAPDQARLAELRQGMRLLMAWASIAADHETLDLTAFQRRQAETKKGEFERTVDTRIQETWVWSLVPYQSDGQGKTEWDISRLQGQDPLAVKMAKRLVNSESLLPRMGPARLKLVLDNYLWGEAEHIATRKLWEYFASYLYLPRLKNQDVLRETIEAGISQLFCEHFGYAGRYDEADRRYEGLVASGGGQVVIDGLSVLVKPEIAKAQLDRVREAGLSGGSTTGDTVAPGTAGITPAVDPDEPAPRPVRRFYATVEIDADRAGRDMGRIAEEILQHLTTLPRARVEVTVEIAAHVPDGVSDEIRRIVTENCQTLRFRTHGFEEE